MKVKCRYCDRIYNNPDQPCPGCGAFNEAGPEFVQRPIQQLQPVPPKAPKRSNAVRVVSITMSAIFLLGLWLFNTNSSTTSSGIASIAQVNSNEVDIVELYKQLEENPLDFAIALKLTTILYSSNKQGEAREVAMYLPRGLCSEASFYREIASVMAKHSDKSYACRMYLCAYQLSGDPADLDSAAECGTPGELMKSGPTTQSLELFFRKPMSLITWEEVGNVKYFAPHYDYIELSLENPAEIEYDFADTVQSFRYDKAEDNEFVYLYGLVSLDIYKGTQLSDTNLFALQRLRSLYISNLSGSQALSDIANIPLLESLHVGGSGITLLEGLDKLPGLRTLSLEGTSIETLSILASYRNIKNLSLKNNKNLTGLSSLEMMDHLEGLHIERQEVLDFRFLEKMHSLKELSLIDTAIKDIFFLSQLNELEALTISKNSDLKTVAGIGELSNLRRLAITANEFNIKGVEEIASLTGLEFLRLYNPTSVSMISGLTSLKTLELNSLSMLDSLSPVAGLSNLETFRVDEHTGGFGYFQASLSPLASLPKLTHVSIPGWALYYSKPLLDIGTLEYLDLTGCRLEYSYTGLSGLANVKTLKLGGTKWLSNVQIWNTGGITNYAWDNVDTNDAVSTISGLTALERLELANTELSDISFMPALPALEYVDLADNYITDISPLGEAKELREVNLSGNPVRDWSIAEGWTHVYVVR